MGCECPLAAARTRRVSRDSERDSDIARGDVVVHAALGRGVVHETPSADTALVEFDDGHRTLVSRRALRRISRVVLNGRTRRDLPSRRGRAVITPHDNEARDLLLAQAFRDAYQQGYDAVNAGRFLARDVRPLLRAGRQFDIRRIIHASRTLRVRSDAEFGPWPRWLERALRSFIATLRLVRTSVPSRRPTLRDRDPAVVDDPAWRDATNETAPWLLWAHAVELSAIRSGANAEIVHKSERIRAVMARAYRNGEPVWMAADEVKQIALAEGRSQPPSVREEMRRVMATNERALNRQRRRRDPDLSHAHLRDPPAVGARGVFQTGPERFTGRILAVDKRYVTVLTDDGRTIYIPRRSLRITLSAAATRKVERAAPRTAAKAMKPRRVSASAPAPSRRAPAPAPSRRAGAPAASRRPAASRGKRVIDPKLVQAIGQAARLAGAKGLKNITEETPIAALGLDSLQMADFVISLEEGLGVDLPDESFYNITTVGQLIDILERALRKKRR